MAKRIQPKLAKGMRDTVGSAIRRRAQLIERARPVFERFGFTPLETPIIELQDVLTGAKAGETSQKIFGWHHEEDDVDLGLRFDLTVPLARFVAANPNIRRPFKRYQVGPVFRVDKPGAGRFREFYQFDIDVVGTRSMLADAEILVAMGQVLEALGLPEYTIRWNHRGVLNAALRLAGIEDKHAIGVIRILDKEDKIGTEGVRAELGDGRVDEESGAPIPGLGLPAQQIDALQGFLEIAEDSDDALVARVKELLADVKGADTTLDEVDELRSHLLTLGVSDRVRFAPKLARGMDYYTGPIYEASLDALPEFGSIMGGGRYDELVSRFSGEQVPGTGASIGVDRLLSALDSLSGDEARASVTDVLVTTMDKNLVTEYLKIVRELREAGINAEVYLKPKARLGDQLKYASDWNIPYALIMGEDELAEGKITLKNLDEGAKAAEGMSDRADWVEQRPGQFSLDRDKVIETMRKLLAD